jgi:signal transduction histidine kinase
MSEKLGNQNAIYVVSTNLGSIHSDLGNFDKALDNFTKATEIARKMGRKADQTTSLINQASVYYDSERLNEALNILNTAHSYAQELKDERILRNAYSLYMKIYDKKGQTDESAKYFSLFAAITRKIQQEEVKRKEEEAKHIVNQATSRVIEVDASKQATEQVLQERDMELVEKQKFLEEAEMESRERLMQIDLLNKERELQLAIISHHSQMQKVYIIIIVLILTFTTYIFYSYYEKKKANALLRQKNIEISRQNSEIQEQAERLSELNCLKDKLFSIISHDLRSPLSSLITLLNLTQQGYFTEEGFKEVIDELSKNVGYTKGLLENLLSWAHSQMQGLKLQSTHFNLHEMANSKFSLYSEQASAKGITLKNVIDESVQVYADSAMIELVFRNLLANAIKFCSNGCTITASASLMPNKVLISINDTGTGISPENLEKLFGKEIFSTKGTSNEKGTGLGLILCKDFVTLNGGEIWAKSVLGVGSEFFFTLPLDKQFEENSYTSSEQIHIAS